MNFLKNIFNALVAAGLASSVLADAVAELSKGLAVTYEAVDVWPKPPLDCPNADWGLCWSGAIHLQTGTDVTDTNWSLYTPWIHRILNSTNPDFTIEHVTGDLHVMKPTATFKGFKAGQKVTIPIVVEYWAQFQTDFMPRAYVTDGQGNNPQTVVSTDSEDVETFSTPLGDKAQSPDDKNVKMTLENRAKVNDELYKAADPASFATRVIPTPLKVTPGQGAVDVSAGLAVDMAALPADMQAAAKALMASQKVAAGAYEVSVKIDPKAVPAEAAKPDGYTLDIAATGATITGNDAGGAFYGLMTLLGLIPQGGKGSIPVATYVDAPRFPYRGVMADVSRNFHKKDAMLRLLDVMAKYKMNKFHWHLTNDEGWRLEIPGLPELTEIGSKRCHDMTEKTCLMTQLGYGPTAGAEPEYYTVQDYIDVLKYAKARNIEVVPEIDMPGHSRAAVVSMEARADTTYRLMDPEDTTKLLTVQFYDKKSLINPCLDSSWNFVKKVITEIKKMHDTAGVPLQTYHFGGDEAKNIYSGGGYEKMPPEMRHHPFEESPACKAKLATLGIPLDELMSWFAQETSKIVAGMGVPSFQGWQDGVKHGNASDYAGTNKVVNFWETLFWGGNDVADGFSERGFQIVLSNPDYTYVDFPNEFNPKERGYYWGSRAQTIARMFAFAPENLPQNAETSTGRDGNPFSIESKAATKPNIIGISAHQWSESVRTDEQWEYMIWPRTAALAERSWHRASWELDYKAGVKFDETTTNVDKKALDADLNQFVNVLAQRELAKIDALGVKFRVPPPGAVVKGGQLTMNAEFPGLTIEYSTDGKTFTTYTAPVNVGLGAKLAFRSSFNGRQSRVETMDLSTCPCLEVDNGANCNRNPDFFSNDYDSATCPAQTTEATADAPAEAAPVAAQPAPAPAAPIEHGTDIYIAIGLTGANVLLLGGCALLSMRKK